MSHSAASHLGLYCLPISQQLYARLLLVTTSNDKSKLCWTGVDELIASQTSSPKGNDAHLRATIQSKKKWKDKFFRRLRAANSVVRGRIWPNFKLIQALMYVIITCKYEKDPIKNNQEKVATPLFKL